MTQNLSDKIVGQLCKAQAKGKESLPLQRISANLGIDALIIFEACEQMVKQGMLCKSMQAGGLTSVKGKRREVEVYSLAKEVAV